MDEKLYEFLCSENILLHGIGEINDSETFLKFKSIIENNALLSKQKLKEKGINVHGRGSLRNTRNTPENCISLFNPSVPGIEKRLLSDKCQYFLPFDPKVIFFLIDSKKIIGKKHDQIPYEVNVEEGYISLQNCVGILIPEDEKMVTFVKEVLKENNNNNIPIYDFHLNKIVEDNENIKKNEYNKSQTISMKSVVSNAITQGLATEDVKKVDDIVHRKISENQIEGVTKDD